MSILPSPVRAFLRKYFPPPLFSLRSRRDRYRHYEVLRSACPVQYFRNRRVWTVSRYEDIVDVLNRPDVFSSIGVGEMENTMVGAEGPEHLRARRIVGRAFAAPQIAAIEGRIRMIAEELITSVVSRKRCELVSEVARPFSLRVIATVLGLDPSRTEDYGRWSDAIITEDYGQLTAEQRQQIAADIDEFDAFLAAQVSRCRRGECRGFVSEQVVPELSDQEAADIFKLLLVAGTATTVNLIGNTVLALLKHPDVMKAARSDPSAIYSVIEETLRHSTPALSIPRRVARDTELAGVRLPADSVLFVLLGSANHAEEHFEDPDRFDIKRDSRAHIAFGSGPHYCLGASLARLEVLTIVTTLLARSKTIRSIVPLDQIECFDHNQIDGPHSLELIVEPSS